jgi:predicted enzyme related to lactoylglutathione lyase
MGQPVVHFEVVGRDGAKLQSYYGELFGWQIDADNPMNYGIVQREGNTNSEGVGIGGGVGPGPEGYDGHVTFYVEVPDVEAALAKAEELGGTRTMGPQEVMEGLVIGLFADPRPTWWASSAAGRNWPRATCAARRRSPLRAPRTTPSRGGSTR